MGSVTGKEDKLKKLFSVLMVGILLIALVGCNSFVIGSSDDSVIVEAVVGGVDLRVEGLDGDDGNVTVAFKTINCPIGTDPVADAGEDFLNLTNSDTYIDITGTSATDVVDFTLDSAVTLDAEWNTIGEIEAVTGVNIIVETEIDSEGELESLLVGVTNVFTDNDTIDISDYTNLVGGTGITLTDDSLSADLGTSIDASEIETGAVGDDEIDYSAVTLADFDYQTAWRVLYTNADGDVTELALGTDGQYLKSAGASSAPIWDTPAGGDITAVGDVASADAFTVDGTAGTSLWFYDAQGRGNLTIADLSGSQTYTLPDATGEISLLGQEIDISNESNLTAGDHITLTDDDLDVDDDFLLNDGDVGTGVYDLGGATSLEIPNDANPTTTVEGQIAYDTDDEAIEVYDGSASRLIGTVHIFSGSIYDPDSIQSTEDAIPILAVESDWAPHGIKLLSVGIKTDSSSSYSVNFEEWTSPDSGSTSTIELVATDTSYEAEDDGIDDSDIAVGSIIYIDLPDTDIDMLQVWGTYYVKDGD